MNIILSIRLIRYLFVAFLVTNLSSLALGQDRDVLFVTGGPFSGSTNSLESAVGDTYMARDAWPQAGATGTTYQSGVQAIDSELSRLSMTNTLGIGFDGGGLFLRTFDHSSFPSASRLSALVLVGTPNQGSELVERFIRRRPDVPSDAEEFVESLQGFKQAITTSCATCRQLESLEELAGNVPNSSSARASLNNSPELLAMPETPSLPTVVMYGDNYDEPRPYTTFLDGGYSPQASDISFARCIDDSSSDARAEFEAEFGVGALDVLYGISTNVARILKVFQNPAAALDQINSFLDEQRRRIREAKQKRLAQAELLECEYVNQAINAEWLLWTIDPGGQSIEVPIIDFYCCEDECFDYFYEQYYGIEDYDGYYDCLADCDPDDPCEETDTGRTRTVLVPANSTDGVYYHAEMDLPGVVETFVMERTAHKDEISPLHTPAWEAYQDLFAGAAGAAFELTPR